MTLSDTKPEETPQEVAALADPDTPADTVLQNRVQNLFDYHGFQPIYAKGEVHVTLAKLHKSTKCVDVSHLGKMISIDVHKVGDSKYQFRLHGLSSYREGKN